MIDFAIRHATGEDLPDLLKLYRQMIPDDTVTDLATAEQRMQQLHLYPGSGIFVGICAETVVASCTLVVIPNLTRGGASYGLIENVVTDAGHRHRGYGRSVLERATAVAWEAGCYKIMLMTSRQDAAIRSFYLGAGFEQSKLGFQIRRPQAAS